jgi:hypothetical protein
VQRSGLVEFGPAITDEIVVPIERLIAGIERIDVHNGEFLTIARRTVQYSPSRCNDLALADIHEAFFPTPFLSANAIRGHGKYSIFKTAGHHGVRAVGKYEIRRMTDEVRSFEGQRANGLGLEPIEADHHS